MDVRPIAVDSCFQAASIPARTTKIPAKFIRVSFDLLQTSEFMFLPIMPEQSLTKNEPERHFVYQCFQCARTDVGAGEICMRPSPEVTMPVPTVMPLNSEPQRASIKTPVIKGDLSRKNRVGMRGSRESNPALIA